MNNERNGSLSREWADVGSTSRSGIKILRVHVSKAPCSRRVCGTFLERDNVLLLEGLRQTAGSAGLWKISLAIRTAQTTQTHGCDRLTTRTRRDATKKVRQNVSFYPIPRFFVDNAFAKRRRLVQLLLQRYLLLYLTPCQLLHQFGHRPSLRRQESPLPSHMRKLCISATQR
jgi:hypothetical protein